MPSIYELSEQQTELLNRLEWLEEGESEHDAIVAYLKTMQGTIEHKIKFLIDILAEARAVAEARKEVAKKTAARAKSAENKAANIEQFILFALTKFDIKKVEGDSHNVSQVMGPKKVLFNDQFNMNDLPDFCVRLIPARMEVDKKEVLALIESGETVEGAVIVREPYLKLS